MQEATHGLYISEVCSTGQVLAKLCFAGIETFGKGLSNCSDEHASGFININNFGFYMYLSKYIESDLFNYIYTSTCNF